jgi:hypothetical protein
VRSGLYRFQLARIHTPRRQLPDRPNHNGRRRLHIELPRREVIPDDSMAPEPHRTSAFLQSIFERFASVVRVGCAPDAFVFSGPIGSQSLDTYFYFERIEHGVKVLAIGTEIPVSSEKIFKSAMFGPNPGIEVPSWLTADYLLPLFVRQGIRLVLTRRPRIPHFRPIVKFCNHRRLDSMLGGHAEDSLRRAAENAGAMKVTFEEQE